MRIRNGYKVREIAGEYIIVNQGIAGVDLTRVISLNSTAKLLFETFAGKEFSVGEVVTVLVEKYGISQELAGADAEKWIEGMKKASILE